VRRKLFSDAFSDAYLLEHIPTYIGRIEEYSQKGRKAFLESQIAQDAVLRDLQILAESTQLLSDPVKQKYNGIPWREISGFRNVIAHRYLSLDLNIIWNVIEKDLPGLKKNIQEIFSSIDPENDTTC